MKVSQLLQEIRDLCAEVEKLPAGEQQTRCSSLAGDLAFVFQNELNGVGLIADERLEQAGRTGNRYIPAQWPAEHDDGHADAELAAGAGCYLDVATMQVRGSQGAALSDLPLVRAEALKYWPWPENESFKPGPDPIRNLVKAGAMIAAEIDRLERRLATRGGA